MFKRQRGHLAIVRRVLQQFLMRPAGKDATEVQHVDDIRLHDGAEAVGNDQAGAVGAQFDQGGLDELLGLYVDGGGGFIQQQHGGVFEEDRATLNFPVVQ